MSVFIEIHLSVETGWVILPITNYKCW